MLRALLYLSLVSALCAVDAHRAYGQSERVWKVPEEADQLRSPHEVTEAFIAAGRLTYEQLCWTCHGDTGLGDGPARTGTIVPPADFTQDSVQVQSDGALYWKLTYGRPPMAAYEKVLTEKERWELVAYIRRLAEPPGAN